MPSNTKGDTVKPYNVTATYYNTYPSNVQSTIVILTSANIETQLQRNELPNMPLKHSAFPKENIYKINKYFKIKDKF